MNGNNNNNVVGTGVKNVPIRPKSLTPSVLGIPNSHGVKLSLAMTPEDKKQLMSKLEEWRKARNEKLAARILTKQKQFEKAKTSFPVLESKSRPASVQHDGASKIQCRQSVFERLYNSGKVKNPKVSSNLSKSTPMPKSSFKKSCSTSSEKQNKPAQVSQSGTDGTKFSHMGTESTSVTGKEYELPATDKPFAENSELDSEVVSVHDSRNTEAIINMPESTDFPKEQSVETEKVVAEIPFKMSQQAESMETESEKSDKVLENVITNVPIKSIQTVRQKNPLRRSISMMFRQKCKNDYTIRRSFSAKNLKEFTLNQQKVNSESMRTTSQPSSSNERERKSEIAAKSVSFVTPNSKTLGSGHLRTKLEDWLKQNGHPLEGYRHLRCFGIANSEKSFPPAQAPSPKNSTENSDYAAPPSTPPNDSDKENVTPATVAEQVDTGVMENWLKELHRLIIQLKYPAERCEEWLTAIRKKCGSCTQLPIYWECLAALHESKGDLESAIEDYERAIIKGGEVDAVGDSLAQLFEKMVIEQNQRTKPKLEKGLNPKNIFKSTIIKFALQQKALKNLSSEIDPGVRQQLYVATPVRRSTRIQTPYKSNGEVSSLQTLTPELRKNVVFKPNESLLAAGAAVAGSACSRDAKAVKEAQKDHSPSISGLYPLAEGEEKEQERGQTGGYGGDLFWKAALMRNEVTMAKCHSLSTEGRYLQMVFRYLAEQTISVLNEWLRNSVNSMFSWTFYDSNVVM